MLVVDLFGVSDSRNNLISAYKQIYKHTYCMCPGTCCVVNFIDGFFFFLFFAGSSRRARVHLPCHGHRKSLFRRTKAFNPPTMAWASLWNDTCRRWVRVEVDSRTFDKVVHPLFSEFPGRPFDRPGWMSPMKCCCGIFLFVFFMDFELKRKFHMKFWIFWLFIIFIFWLFHFSESVWQNNYLVLQHQQNLKLK